MPCTLSVLVTGLTCRRVLCHNMLLRAACGDGVLLVALLSRCVCAIGCHCIQHHLHPIHQLMWCCATVVRRDAGAHDCAQGALLS